MKQRGFRYCLSCGTKLQKNGYNLTKKGRKTKHRCPSCHTNSQHYRPDLTRKHQLKRFVSYLIGTAPATDYFSSLSSFRRQSAWCWQVRPLLLITGEVCGYLVIDAKPIKGAVCAIVRNHGYVLNWEHGLSENSELWRSVLSALPRPKAVVCDGQKGIFKALNQLWPEIIIQRCHVHVRRNIRVKISLNPKTEAGADLKWLMPRLKQVEDYDSMAEFIALFNALYDAHVSFLSQRTTNPNPTASKKWWYTHSRVLSAYRQIAKLIDDNHLFQTWH
jgi:transposase-like protein